MSIAGLAIWFVVVVAIIAIVVTFAGRTTLWGKVPQELKIALYAILAIVAILFVASLAGPGPPLVR